MEPALRSAFTKASLKLAGGLLLVAAVIGVRVVMVSPEGVEAEVAELEQVEAEIAAEDAAAEREPSMTPESERDSVVTRFSDRVSERLPGGGSGESDGQRLVACDLSGRTQFMRAADCSSRGGTSTDLD